MNINIRDKSFDLDHIRQNWDRPRVHGNGFIQLDLDKTHRLHIWGDPRIPRQTVATHIHDHVFSFFSDILVGRLLQVRYHLNTARVQGSYKIYAPRIRKDEDTILEPTELPTVNVVAETPVLIAAGTNSRGYYMPAFQFHETFTTGPAATLIVKEDPRLFVENATPRVLVPVGQEPDNVFNRYDASKDLLWQIIEDTLKLAP